jgi:DmsE family decaheme c-type cytochrome
MIVKPFGFLFRWCAIISFLWLSCASMAADAVADRTLTGDKVCTACHDESEAKAVLAIYKTAHGVKADARTPGCQSCHGPSEAHVKNAAGKEIRPLVDINFGRKDASSVAVQTETCLGCHKTGMRMHWAGSQHQSGDVSCTSCHMVHAKVDKVMDKVAQPEVCFTCHKSQRAQMHRLSTHPVVAGKMSCSDCHNPHGSTGPKLMVKNSINETCYTCHAERRGPFLFEHTPVTDDCSNCHTPHGSNNTALLKVRTPFLCQSCHTADHSGVANSASHLPGGATTTVNGRQPLANQSPRAQMNGRNCLSCHSVVHGSNHPAGAKFNR